jgi:HK97 family phage major capsid protein
MGNTVNGYKKDRRVLLDQADSLLKTAEESKRPLTSVESSAITALMAQASGLGEKIETAESRSTIRTAFSTPIALMEGGGFSGVNGAPRGFGKPQQKRFAAEYASEFYEYIQSNGKKIGAALYEGSESGGGYAVPVIVDDQIVPLAPQEQAVRRLATVLPTVSDIKIPIKASFGTASAKAETTSFGESELTLSQVTLSAFMAGIQENISWELAQDVPTFQATTVDDMVLAQQMYEENLYVNGTGSGQAQGLIGNVGAGVTEEPDTNGNLVSISGTLDLTGKLNAVYHPGASWLMSRPTSIIIRKAQVESNLFNPAWTRQGNQDYLHGYPVFYSASMPAAARGSSPVLFGDFKRGYIIGDRGGSGINVKVLDQPLATQGLLVLLAYRRTDGRVRRSEAIQEYTIAAS